MRSHDTSGAAEEVQVAIYRRMAPAARVELAVTMSEEAREVSRAGIAARHPEYSSLQVEQALRRLLLGDELFRRAWPAAPLLSP
jgi:hypothetical protein